MDFLNTFFNYENGKITYGLTNELISFYVLNLFKKENRNIIVVTSTTYEANRVFNSIKTYNDCCSLFPMDDFLTSVALAVSPEFKYSRIETLNNLKNHKNIVVTNLTGYLKFLPSIKAHTTLELKQNMSFSKNELLNTIESLGYNKESLVTGTGEYASRGMIVDIYPLNEEKPIRIEYNGNIIEDIKYFDEETQLSTTKIDSIIINAVDEIETEINSSLYDYTSDGIVVFMNKGQIDVSYERLLNEIESYNNSNDINTKHMFSIDDIKPKTELYIDSINNKTNITINEIQNYNENYELLVNNYDKWKKSGKEVIFYLPLPKQKEIIKTYIPDAYIVPKKINKGFIIDKYVVISDNDIGSSKNERINYKNNLKIGKKIKSYNDLEKGDYVVHIAHGIGIYNGIVTLTKDGIEKDYIQILYDKNDKIYIPVEKINTIYKYSDKNGVVPKINKLNSSSWIKTRNNARSKAKDISKELMELYAARATIKGDQYKTYELEEVFSEQFEYIPTRDQLKAINDINNDLKSTVPMDRLLCGDVGFGKTEVANRAIYKTVLNNKQVMYLCPTTILSNQQYNVIKNRFSNEAVEIALLNRFTTAKETTRIKKELYAGKIDIIVGTHRLLSDDVKFSSLGLLVVDEEQRFGVAHKEKIKKYKEDINVLTLSATPIPRTMKMALSGLRDLSIIDTPPVNRYPVQTYVISENDLLIKDAIYKELSRNGQVFILNNKISNLEDVKYRINKLVPEARIGIAHGQMTKSELEGIMTSFVNYEYDILLCTTIIENGIDISNANTLLVFDADNFGLSQLYQIRGRVGRSNKIAYAYLFYNPKKQLNDIAIKRLQAIKDFTELGSGYKIAMRDLAIRGAGDVFGSDQAGFVDSIGISLYIKLIDDEIKKAHGEYVEEEDDDNNLIEVSTHIKDSYVSDEDIKIEIHQLINKIDSLEKLKEVKKELTDRFGKIDEDMEIYMYEEWFTYLAKKLNIDINSKTDRYIEIKLSEELSSKIKGDRLLIDVLQLSTKFNINYKRNMIFISLFYKTLDKHYIYYLVKLLKIIENNVNI